MLPSLVNLSTVVSSPTARARDEQALAPSGLSPRRLPNSLRGSGAILGRAGVLAVALLCTWSTLAADPYPGFGCVPIDGPHVVVFRTNDGRCLVTLDTTETPDLTEWAHEELVPVVQEWYPKISRLLPSPGYRPPEEVTIFFRADRKGVAGARGTRIECAGKWFRRNLESGAKGAMVHELTHVVQQYGRNGNKRPPKWLSEGIATYVRRYLYEPEKNGAYIAPEDSPDADYDGSYRVTANFLNWVTIYHDPHIVPYLNAAAREGRYSIDLWHLRTGLNVDELEVRWKADLLRDYDRDDTMANASRRPQASGAGR